MFPRFLSGFLTLIFAHAAHAGVLINELMYQRSGVPENTAAEFIELLNTDAVAVSLSGWRFTNGVSFIFPANATIAPGGYLVVAANVAAFQAAHPGVTNVVGGWSGTLSNSGEAIELADAQGVPQDRVEYADEGDWAIRVREPSFGGWDWSSLADGGGRSLELRSATIENDNGQNWGSSAADGGTPGTANSLASANVAPLISGVQHSPAVPRALQPVTISCTLTDELPAPNLAATLFWRDVTNGSPSFQSVPMAGDGLGGFAATLGGKADKVIIEFYVSVTDGSLTRTFPAPTSEGQNANAHYQVDNEDYTGSDQMIRLVLTKAENDAFENVNSQSNREFHCTLIGITGSDETIRYSSSFRIRGASSRGYVFKPLQISIPGDRPWDGVTKFNCNPKYPWSQYLGMKLMQAAGVRAPDAVPVELRRNGVEYSTGGSNAQDFGRWVRIEDLSGEFINEKWPLDDDGNLYKKVRPDNSWAYRNGDIGSYLGDGWSKETNAATYDWSDLDNFLGVVQQTAAPHFPGGWDGTGLTSAQYTQLGAVADFAQWWRWFGVQNIVGNAETNLSNGADDDYSVYIGAESGKVEFIPHDFDTIFGIGEGARSPTSNVFDQTQDGDVLESLLPLFGTANTPGNLTARLAYYVTLRELLNTVFAEPGFSAFVDNHLTGWVPAGSRQSIKDYLATRRDAILAAIAADPSVALPPYNPPAPTSTGMLTSSHGALMISEVLARNVSAAPNAGTFPDVIELRNTGATAIDLSGKSLTDDPLDITQYIFPAGTSIAAGGHLLVYADSAATPGLHAGFALDQAGEMVQLYDSVAAGQVLLDSVTFGPQAPDLSISRTGAGLNVWALTAPTLGAANGSALPTASVANVRINEVLANPDYLLSAEFVELHNSAAQPVALGGVAITDDFINFPAQHVLPPLSFIGAGGFARLDPLGSSASPGRAGELPFKLASLSGVVALNGANGARVDTLDYDSLAPDTSRGRSPDGADAIVNFSLPVNGPTPGVSNSALPASVLALLNGLRVTELLYQPNNHEYLELQNIGATTLDLSGVRFTSGVTYTFAPGTTLTPGAFIVVCANRSAFQARFGAGVPLAAGVFSGSLSNNGETITLRPPEPWDINILNFKYDVAWYGDSNNSLVINDPSATLPRDWDEKASWSLSAAAGGTPGSDGPPTITSALSAAGVIGDAFAYQIIATRFPTSYSATPLPPGLSINPGTGLISGTPTIAGFFTVNLGATNAGGTDVDQLTISIATSGPLASFVWNPVSSPKQAAAPFAVTIRALDAQGRTVTSYGGTPALTGSILGTGTGATIVVTETSLGNVDSCELQNVSNAAVDTAGWFTVLNNGSGGLNVIHGPFALPSSFAAGEIHVQIEGQNIGNISFPNAGPAWAMVVDAAGVIRDFFPWGYSQEQIESISVEANGFTLSPSAQGAWTGGGAFVGGPTNDAQGLQRSGTEDHNNATDWALGSATRGVQNNGLTLPFPGGNTPNAVTPAVASGFVNGVWTGNVTLATPGASVRLRVDDGTGHAANSNAFAVSAPAPPVITSPGSAIAVIGQPFSYQILATNLPASFGASNLPAGLAVNPTTGLISGTPTAAATTPIQLSVNGPGGTANAPLSLQVQSDADGDGMGGAWETSFGLNPANSADAALDKDGDGQSNRAEWLAGTSPISSSARLAILSEQAIGTGVQLTWSSVVGKRYRVLFRNDLVAGTWQVLTASPVVATGATASFLHVGGLSGTLTRFYRVEVVP